MSWLQAVNDRFLTHGHPRPGKTGTAGHHPPAPFSDRAGRVSLGAKADRRRLIGRLNLSCVPRGGGCLSRDERQRLWTHGAWIRVGSAVMRAADNKAVVSESRRLDIG